jgi:hypothetical protein
MENHEFLETWSGRSGGLLPMNIGRIDVDRWARRLFAVSALALSMAYGALAGVWSLFPVPQARKAGATFHQLLEISGTRLPWYFGATSETREAIAVDAGAMLPGLTLVSGLAGDREMSIRVVEPAGRVVQNWRFTWDGLWPDPSHLSAGELPGTNPAHVHGVVVLPDGDLVFNFDFLGMLRLNPCGKVVWRLPYRTHHAIDVDEQGNLWTLGKVTRHARVPGLPNHAPPFEDYTVLRVSPEGRLLEELSVFDLLIDNGLRPLLHMSAVGSSTEVSGDTLHVNDVEVFPASLAPGVFAAGDLMVSFRNINAVIVFAAGTRRVKFMSIGQVLHQHDPDFVDGSTISVFDNNPLGTRRNPAGHFSRLVRLSAADPGLVDVRFEGTVEQPFFTDVMGKHQNLSNGNSLLVESVGGRVIEVDAARRVVWRYTNLIRDGVEGLVDDAIRLPQAMDAAFFAAARAACSP